MQFSSCRLFAPFGESKGTRRPLGAYKPKRGRRKKGLAVPWLSLSNCGGGCTCLLQKKTCLSFFSLSQLKMLAAEGCHRRFLVTQFGTTLTEVSPLSDLQVPCVHPSIPAGCFQPLWGAHSPSVSEVWHGCGARGLPYFAPVCTPQVPADITLAPCWLCTDIFSS